MRSDTPPSEVTVTINGDDFEARPGEMLIAAADRAGVHIPRFCYHERMSSVGMCRMCLVDIDTGRGPMLQPSCMVPVAEGMVVDTQSEETKRAQEGILEFLLVNHPLDMHDLLCGLSRRRGVFAEPTRAIPRSRR